MIDFCEPVGEHSGENMANAVYKTMSLYDNTDVRHQAFNAVLDSGHILWPPGVIEGLPHQPAKQCSPPSQGITDQGPPEAQ